MGPGLLSTSGSPTPCTPTSPPCKDLSERTMGLGLMVPQGKGWGTDTGEVGGTKRQTDNKEWGRESLQKEGHGQ